MMSRSLLGLAIALAISLAGLAVQAADLGDVQTGMTEEKVRGLLGEPDDKAGYPTWKRFIPRMGRWSNDRKRMDWIYQGKGKVIFSHNQYSGMYKVVKVVPEDTTAE